MILSTGNVGLLSPKNRCLFPTLLFTSPALVFSGVPFPSGTSCPPLSSAAFPVSFSTLISLLGNILFRRASFCSQASLSVVRYNSLTDSAVRVQITRAHLCTKVSHTEASFSATIKTACWPSRETTSLGFQIGLFWQTIICPLPPQECPDCRFATEAAGRGHGRPRKAALGKHRHHSGSQVCHQVPD